MSRKELLFVGFVLVAAMAAPTIAAATTPEQVLKDLIESRRPLEDLRLHLETGEEDYRGRSVLSLSGDGLMVLEVGSGGEVERHENRLSDAAVINLVRLLVDIKVWALEPTGGTRPPDAEEMVVRLRTQQSDLKVEVRFLVADAADSPELIAVVDLFRALESIALGEP